MTTTTRVKVRSAGGSLIATIPKEVIEKEGIQAGDELIATFKTRRQALNEFIGSVAGIKWDRTWTRGRDRY